MKAINNRVPILAENRFEVDKEIQKIWEWSKVNPVKAASISAIGIISLRSKLLRVLVLMSITSMGTLLIRSKIAKSEILH